ncbi:MAG: type II toxin-antitoxin system VapC family toxin [Vulcanimicrobiota bacterium]
MDTDICVYLIKRRPPAVIERLRSHPPGEIGVSSVTVAELSYGVEKSQHREGNKAALRQFLLPLVVLDFNHEAALTYGEVRATLERAGTPIGPFDTMIGAHALHLNATLVTNNLWEFSRIIGLRTENWSA